MVPVLKIIEALTKLAPHAGKLVPLILSFAVFAAVIFLGLHGRVS
jgi:hypothetical protein